ncbi:ABC transporter permease [Desulfoluna butyratoxydans]|uniref:Transport permease protein n=1 Tax=Desulfoluna butyratoxydans TaxID=231438 RepID=A0A4U8YZL9_9BACT|nr:ABC transporter permease [Desulfoluna butyratoxydans]VFQ47303.1 abc-2 type transporter [Desulfoluna butyratoxydans]
MTQFELIIEPDKSIKNFWRELWQYRDLFYFLAWRDVLVRYKQTVIGVAWSVLRPLLTMVVFTIIFGKIAKLPSGDIPYPILVFSAMLPWQFFSNTFSEASNSLIANTQLISKVYFPRIIIPTTAMVVSLIDFAISFIILLALMLWYGLIPDIKLCLLPLLMLMAILTSLGAGYIMSALNVKYRDFRHIVPYIVQFGLYISPVGFSSGIVPEKWRLLYSVNPMVGVIDGFRWILLGNDTTIYWPGFTISIALSILIFFTGGKYFRITERSFADII